MASKRVTRSNRLFTPGRNGFGTPLDRRQFLRQMTAMSGLVVAGGLLQACGDGEDVVEEVTNGEAVGAGMTIGLSLNGLVDYTTYVAQGMLYELQDTDYDWLILQANFDTAAELSNIESLIAQGIDGLVIQPNNAETAAEGARLAAEADLPVGHCLWPGESPGDEYLDGVAYLDSVEGGRLIGEWLKANVEPGQIIVVQGVVGQGFSERIDEGLDEALEGTDFEIVLREQGFFDRSEAVRVVETGLEANPDVTIIIDYAATMSNGISSWLQDEGRDDIIHVTSDADEEMVDWMDTPYLDATRYYSAAETGRIATQAVRDVIEGREPEFQTPIFQEIATAENLEDVMETNPFMYSEFAEEVRQAV